MSNTTAQSPWQSEKLKNLPIQIIDGDRSARYPKRDEFQKEGILFLNTTNIEQNRLKLADANFVTEEKFAQIKKGRLQRLDIVMTTRGSIGKLALFNCEYSTGLINAQMLILRADGHIIDQKFLFYLLCSDTLQSQIKNFSSGSAQPQIPIQDLREIEINYPPLPIQRKIAAILSTYDRLIENNTRRIEILEEMARSIYREWFVKFRFPGHEQAQMVDSELGPIPEGWEVKKLFDIAEVTYGFPFKSKQFTEESVGKPVIRIRNIKNNATKTFTTESAPDKYIVNNGDILVGMDGDFHREKWCGGEAYLNQRVVRFRPKNNLSFYYLFLALEKPIQYFDFTVVGTTVAHLSDKHLRSINLMVPDKFFCERVKDMLNPLFKLELNLHLKNANLRQTRDLLLPRLISGEIDVENLDIKTSQNAA